MKIQRLEKKKLLGKDTDYAFTRIEKDTSKLKDYQEYLLEKIFTSSHIKDSEDLFLAFFSLSFSQSS